MQVDEGTLALKKGGGIKGRRMTKKGKTEKKGKITGKSRELVAKLLKASFVPGDFPRHSHWPPRWYKNPSFRFHSARNPSDLLPPIFFTFLPDKLMPAIATP